MIYFYLPNSKQTFIKKVRIKYGIWNMKKKYFIKPQCQGSKGIRQWLLNWYSSQNSLLCRLQLVVETFGHSSQQPIKIQWKSPKLLSQRIRKRHYKTLGSSVINSLLSTLSLKNITSSQSSCSFKERICCDLLKKRSACSQLPCWQLIIALKICCFL